MTVEKAVKDFDLLFPNALTYGQKVEALSRLDRRIFTELLSRYEGCPVEEFGGYGGETPGNTRLLADGSFEGIYVKYLAAFADFINGDIARYNNSAGAFNTEYEALCRAYNRTHIWKNSAKMGDII